MDFSSANIQLWSFLLQFGALAGILLLANFLRRKLPFVKKTLIPTAVLAGFLLLALRLCGLNIVKIEILEMITYHGIAMGFIALSLRVPETEERGIDRITAPKSGALIVSCYTIQGVIGLIIALALVYTVLPGFFRASGLLLPMGYGQGPGQANNIGTAYEKLGFIGGRSFGLSLAAAGYLSACTVGVVYLNVLWRKGRFIKTTVEEESGSVTVNTFQDIDEIPVSESIDKFSIQTAMVLGVYLLSYFVILGITSLTKNMGEGLSKTISTLLWGFNFMVGTLIAMLIRVIFKSLRKSKVMTRQYQNNYLLSRISGFAFDLMVIAGIALIDIGDIKGLWLPFILMSVIGAAFTLVYLRWLCKKIYPGYYYEGMLSMYGMMTGTISSGVLLLREIDPLFKTPAANNLVAGSGMAVLFGAPMLALIGIAPLSSSSVWLVLGLLVVYSVLLILFMLKVKGKARRRQSGNNRTA
ncbi:MAG: hypothetical protein LBG91_03755 [Treponema sp.]|nr:hypothetical protein [Treponema sp.]